MQILLNALISGSAIALVAVAFQIVYLPTRVFFIGLGGIYSLAPFIAYASLKYGAGWTLAIAGTLLVCVVGSLLCEWLNHARLTRRHASSGAHLVTSLGIYILIVQGIAMVWGDETKTLHLGLDSTTQVGGVVVAGAQWITLSVAVLFIGGFAAFLAHSDLGLRLRALADNPDQFALFGYNVDRHRLLAFGLAGLLAGISALATAYDIGFDPNAGLHAVLLAVVAVIIGGQSSMLGPVVGALLLGVLRAQVVWYWSAGWADAATFGILAAFLVLRPHGLLGRKSRLEVAA